MLVTFVPHFLAHTVFFPEKRSLEVKVFRRTAWAFANSSRDFSIRIHAFFKLQSLQEQQTLLGARLAIRLMNSLEDQRADLSPPSVPPCQRVARSQATLPPGRVRGCANASATVCVDGGSVVAKIAC
ncbi:unnamed protein product [Schistocephalus solidus]|uniref:Uncharacterized protein n=1 Tax=Schistocephalus solidus TaxID=70667 RepID=A0A183SI41_SCHSO|nr:unnamed protein product [Schistocephalus solidus]